MTLTSMLSKGQLDFFFSKVDSVPRVEPSVGIELKTLKPRPELRSRVRCLTNLPPRRRMGQLRFKANCWKIINK